MKRLLPGMTTGFGRARVALMSAVGWICWVCGITRLTLRFFSSRPYTVVLGYHRINPNGEGSVEGYRENVTDSQRFIEHLNFLRANFEPRSITDLHARSGDRKSARSGVAITFDDGYRDVLIYAYPLLEKAGFPAAIFVVSGILKGYILPADRFVGFRPGSHRLYLDKEELATLFHGGFVVGSHTMSHPILDERTAVEIRREMTASKRALEEALCCSIDTISLPIGGVPGDGRSVIQDVGYRMAFINTFGAVLPGDDELMVPRVSASDFPVPVLAFKIAVAFVLRFIRGQAQND